MNFLKMVASMATPTPILAAISPERAYRRLVRRAAWHIARPIRFGFHHSRRAATRISGAIAAGRAAYAGERAFDHRPINQAVSPDAIAHARQTAQQAAPFLPKRSAKLLQLLDANAPVGDVLHELAGIVGDVPALMALAKAGNKHPVL